MGIKHGGITASQKYRQKACTRIRILRDRRLILNRWNDYQRLTITRWLRSTWMIRMCIRWTKTWVRLRFLLGKTVWAHRELWRKVVVLGTVSIHLLYRARLWGKKCSKKVATLRQQDNHQSRLSETNPASHKSIARSSSSQGLSLLKWAVSRRMGSSRRLMDHGNQSESKLKLTTTMVRPRSSEDQNKESVNVAVDSQW